MKRSTKLNNSIKIIICVFVSLSINAEEFKIGSEIEATANINFREKVKYSYWSDPKILKVVRPGDKLTVIKTQKINIPFLKGRVWLNVQDASSGEIGWVYNGKAGENGYFANRDLIKDGEIQ